MACSHPSFFSTLPASSSLTFAAPLVASSPACWLPSGSRGLDVAFCLYLRRHGLKAFLLRVVPSFVYTPCSRASSHFARGPCRRSLFCFAPSVAAAHGAFTALHTRRPLFFPVALHRLFLPHVTGFAR